MRYFSLFSGIGGFEIAIERTTNWKCIGHSEINPYSIKIYEKHFKGVKNYGDATKIKTKNLPAFDFLVAGFPCQAFSIAGKREGFNDTRGTLFFEVARILKEKRPKYFLLENVKGLLSHEKGQTFQTILRILTKMGYCVEWQVLNSRYFGVPQNRERIFIAGNLRNRCRRKIFPIRGKAETNIKKQKIKFIDLVLNDAEVTNVCRTIQARYYKSYSSRYGEISGVLHKGKIRRFTPLECERLQSFPEGWTEGISDCQRYKCLGNAVTVNVVEEVMTRFLGVIQYAKNYTI